MEDCFICRKHREMPPEAVIYEDEMVIASHAAPQADGQVYRGWCLIEPRRHAPGLPDLTESEAERVGRLMASLGRAMRDELKAEHIYAFVLGHHAAHLHVHLLARYPGTPRQYWGQRLDEWPEAPKVNGAGIDLLVSRLKKRLEDKQT